MIATWPTAAHHCGYLRKNQARGGLYFACFDGILQAMSEPSNPSPWRMFALGLLLIGLFLGLTELLLMVTSGGTR